jgi:hypothetical protein
MVLGQQCPRSQGARLGMPEVDLAVRLGVGCVAHTNNCNSNSNSFPNMPWVMAKSRWQSRAAAETDPVL